MSLALDVRSLKKSYGRIPAVDGVSFRVEPGECVGLLGPNGAGKTTTLSIVAGLLEADSGEVWLSGRRLGKDDSTWKRGLGVVPQEIALYPELTARENLEFFGILQGLASERCRRRAGEVLVLVGLEDRAGDRVRGFSGGMQRRLNLGASLMHEPGLLLLDEPTVGVDPQSRNALFETLEGLQQSGCTLVYTTHYMEEVERLCDRVVIVDRGRVVADDTVRGLQQRVAGRNRVRIEVGDLGLVGRAVECLQKLAGVKDVVEEEGGLGVSVESVGEGVRQVLEALGGAGIGVVHVRTERPTLESVFLELTGRALRDGSAGLDPERSC